MALEANSRLDGFRDRRGEFIVTSNYKDICGSRGARRMSPRNQQWCGGGVRDTEDGRAHAQASARVSTSPEKAPAGKEEIGASATRFLRCAR